MAITIQDNKTTQSISTDDKIKGAIYGLLIGDAVGVPYEFKHPDDLPPLNQIDMTPPKGFSCTYVDVPLGTWSDDGAQALALLASLIDCDGLNEQDFMEKMLAWYNKGAFTPDGVVFDIGIQTRQALGRYQQGTPLEYCANNDRRSNGNGALMRVMPLAIWYAIKGGTDQAMIADAYRQSSLTHGHLLSKLCCAFYCLWAKNVFLGQAINAGFYNAHQCLLAYYHSLNDNQALAEMNAIDWYAKDGQGSGYVVDSLKSAYLALQAPSYEQVIKKAVSMGNDTDTTACIAGGLAGLAFGVSALPEAWLIMLKGKTMVDELLAKL